MASNAMTEPQILIPLTEEDRKLLEKNYFMVWTIYRRMLIGMAVVFGGLWVWIGWETLQDPDELKETFVLLTVILLGLLAFGLLSTPVYRRKTALPLEKDLEEGKKIYATGQIIAIKSNNKYTNKMIFQPQDGSDVKEFVIHSKITAVSYDAFHLGKDITIEHTPHARVIVRAALVVPVTTEEKEEQNKKETTDTIAIFILVGMLILGLGWLFDLLLICTLIYLVVIASILVVIWWEKQKPGAEKQRANAILITVAVNSVAPFVFLVASKTLFDEWVWKLENWSGGNVYLVLAGVYAVFAVVVNLILRILYTKS